MRVQYPEWIGKSYTVDDLGYIRSPGRYQGQLAWVAHFALEEPSYIVDEADYYIVNDKDRELFPELLRGVWGVCLHYAVDAVKGTMFLTEFDYKADMQALEESYEEA